MARSTSSSTTLLIAIILVITFPIWFAIGAALFGVIIGLFGAAIGTIAAIFGVCIAIIVLPFKLFFGWGDHSFHFPFFHTNNGFMILILIVIALIIVQRGKKVDKA